MGAVLVINVSGVETRVALVENGTISEYYLERKKDKGIVGNIYKGRVVRVLPGMQAAFVDIGLDKAAFLYVNDVFYDPDFSEQQFELTEGEHAEFDDDLDEDIELNAGGETSAKTPLPAEAPPQLTIVTPSLLETPGELKTPCALNGSVSPAEQCAEGKAPVPGGQTEAADDAAQAASVRGEDVTAGQQSAVPAEPLEVSSAPLAAMPPSAEVPSIETLPPTAVALAAGCGAADGSERDLTSGQPEAGTAASDPGAAAHAGAGTSTPAVSAPQVQVDRSAGGAQPMTAEVAEECAASPESDAQPVGEADKGLGDSAERRGELRARSRRRRRGGSARRELRHGEQGDQDREERPAEENATPSPSEAGAAVHEALADVPPALPAETDTDARAAARVCDVSLSAPLEAAKTCDAVTSCPESARASDSDQEGRKASEPAAAPAAVELLAPAEVPAAEGAPGSEDPTPAAEAQEATAESDRAPSIEQERTPVAEPRGNGRHHGRNGDRNRRGGRAERNALEAKSFERGSSGDDAAERGDSDSGRAKRRPTANIQDLLKVGQEIIVQVAKDPIGTKGARVTSHISIPGRQIVFMPTVDHVGISRRIEKESERRRLREIVERIRPPGTGFIVRTVAENISTEKLEADARFLIGIWSEVVAKKDKIGAPALLHPDLDLTLRATRDLFVQDVEKLVIDDRAEWERISRFVAAQAPALKDRVVLHEGDEPIFDAYGIEHELQRAYSRKVWLKSGGYLIIDQAEALTAIDVNSGRYVGKKSLEETITRINIEAAKEIVYQLRLRNIGGIMIIDFIDMAKAQNRDKVFKALQEALGRDKARTNILKISELGLIEMTRKRVRESLGRTLNEPCSYCDGRGYMKSKRTMAYEIFREIRRGANNFKEGAIVVNCHPEVARILQVEERDELRYLMDRFNKTIVVRPQQGYHQEQFEIYGKAERQPRARAEREQRDSERRHDREQRQAEQGSLRLTADRSPLRKPGDPQPDRKPAATSSSLAEPQGRLAEYPPGKSGSQQ